MMEWLLLSALILLVLAVCFGPVGMDVTETIARRTYATVGLGLLVVLWSGDWLAVSIWLIWCGNALAKPFSGMHTLRLATILLCFVAYRLLSATMTEDSRLVLLILLASLPLIGAIKERIYLDQGQQNHADALVTIGLSASIALIAYYSFWPFLPLCVANCAIWGYHALYKADRFGMPVLWMGVVAGLAAMLYAPLMAYLLIPAGLVSLGLALWLLHRRRDGPDHERVMMWYLLLRAGWWGSGWRSRLFGLGWNSWTDWAQGFAMMEWQKQGKKLEDYAKNGQFWSHPHNEYVWMLFEHGAVGLLCLVSWLAWHGWLALHGSSLQQASLLPASALCAIAFTHFCWRFPTEKLWGNMGLAGVSLVIAVLIG